MPAMVGTRHAQHAEHGQRQGDQFAGGQRLAQHGGAQQGRDHEAELRDRQHHAGIALLERQNREPDDSADQPARKQPIAQDAPACAGRRASLGA